MVKLDNEKKIVIAITAAIIIIFGTCLFYKNEKISKANIKIETHNINYYTFKETIQIDPGSLCIDFYDLDKEFYVKHCGEFTIKYLK